MSWWEEGHPREDVMISMIWSFSSAFPWCQVPHCMNSGCGDTELILTRPKINSVLGFTDDGSLSIVSGIFPFIESSPYT